MKYYIYQGTGTDGELTKIAEVEDKKEYTVTGLTANSTYRFAVSSYNGLRESAKSNVITVKTSAIPVQSITLAIDKTALEVGGTAKVTVTITPANEIDGAAVLTSSNPQVATIDGAGNVKAIAPGTATITAKVGEKVSNVISLTVYEALVNVANLAAKNVTANSVDLSWDWWWMQYRIRNGDQLIGTVNNKQYQVTGLTPNVAYNLSVASFNGFRESPRTSLTVKTRGIQVKVPVSLAAGTTVSLVYLEYALGLVPIETEPKGMFGGGNRQILPAKVISSANGMSTIEITNSFNLMSDGLTMKQLPDKSFGVFEGYKALYYKGD